MSETILCVDDDPGIQHLFGRLLEPSGHVCVPARSVEEARELLATGSFALVLCDIGLGDGSGLDLLDELAALAPETATLMVTGRDEVELADATLGRGAYGYLAKPFSGKRLLMDVAGALHRRRLELESRDYETMLEATVSRRTRQLGDAYEETLARLGRAIALRDGETGAHLERVGSYAARIAASLGFDVARIELIRRAATLHDIGKIAVRDDLLLKPGAFDATERSAMQLHAAAGHALLRGSGSELLELAATIAWTHHERWDGSGYPRGLAGEAIPLEGRIVAVADVYDALTTDRPYRPGLTHEEARSAIAERAGTDFDPRVAEVFLAVVQRPVLTAA